VQLDEDRANISKIEGVLYLLKVRRSSSLQFPFSNPVAIDDGKLSEIVIVCVVALGLYLWFTSVVAMTIALIRDKRRLGSLLIQVKEDIHWIPFNWWCFKTAP
ncbi:hypothetical protein TELCIR_11992, partial [Teladorsagia circumcincta]